MKCLIIAAGKGTRLSAKGTTKPLVPLLGMPLIERVIRAANKGGVQEFYVVTGYNGEALRAFLHEVAQATHLPITTVVNEQWEQGNGLSVLKARKWLQENFMLLMSDHIFDYRIIEAVYKYPLDGNEVCLAVDGNLQASERIDIDDVTKVLERDGKIVDIGKQIAEYNAYDTGIFLCGPGLFDAIEVAMAQRGDSSLSGGIKVLADQHRAGTINIKGRFWMDIDDEKMFAVAERLLKAADES